MERVRARASSYCRKRGGEIGTRFGGEGRQELRLTGRFQCAEKRRVERGRDS